MDLQDRFSRINLTQGKRGGSNATPLPSVLSESTNYSFMRETTSSLQKKVDFKRKKVEVPVKPKAPVPSAVSVSPSKPSRHPLRLLAEVPPRLSEIDHSPPKPSPQRRLLKSQSIPVLSRTSDNVFSRLYPGPPSRTRVPPSVPAPVKHHSTAKQPKTQAKKKVSDLSAIFARFDRDLVDESHDVTVEVNTPLRRDQFDLEQHQLSIYERGELIRPKSVYYIPNRKIRSSAGRNDLAEGNYGFDDADGNYMVHKGDHVNYRFEICSTLGTGSFGTVIMARDHKIMSPPRYVAIKIIKNDLQWSLQSVKEIKTLKQLNYHEQPCDHILNYIDYFNFRSHMCIITELLSLNLYSLLELVEFNGLSEQLVKKIARQLLLGTQFIHRNGIIHCDIKPENIMLRLGPGDHDFTVKLIDFGTSCPHDDISFTYIQSRYYRAPEVILGAKYSYHIDIWSVGCVLAELFNGTPLLAGKSEIEQCGLILELLGCPKPSTILNYRRLLQKSLQKQALNPESRFMAPLSMNDKVIKRTLLFKVFDGQGKLNQSIFSQYLANAPASRRHFKPGARPIEAQLELATTSAFASFFGQIFNWDAFERASADELLAHPFLQDQS